MSIYLSFEIVTVPKLGVYSAISSKQIAMKVRRGLAGGVEAVAGGGGSWDSGCVWRGL